MTKKDYIQIAAVLNERIRTMRSQGNQEEYIKVMYEPLVIALCNMFMKDNSRFDEDKFYEAVYKE